MEGGAGGEMRRHFEGWMEGGYSSRMRDDGSLYQGDARRDRKKY